MVETLTLAIDARRVKQGERDFNSAGRGISSSAERIDRSVDRTERKVKSLGRTSSSVGALMTRFLTGAAIAAGTRGAIRTFAEYEQSIATVRAVLGGQIKDQARLEESMNRIEATARKLGATTRFTASDAAEGILFLSRAGFDADQSVEAIGATLNLAQAGFISLGQAADYASNIVKGFGLEANETNRVVDVMVATSNRANTNVEQMAEAMKHVAPFASSLGASVESTAAAIGVLGDAGIQASMAGTNLRGVFIRLLSPSGEAKKAIDSIGLSIDDLSPASNDLATIFDRLRKATEDLTRDDRARVFSDIFMARNVSAALVLSESTKRIRELTQANIEAEGEASEFARVMDDTLVGAAKSLLSATQELILGWGDEGGLGGVLRDAVITATGAVRILSGLGDTVEENRDAAFLLAAALKGVGIAASILVGLKLATMASSILVSLVGMPAAIAATSASLIPLAAAVAAVGAAALSFELGRYFYEEFRSVQETMAFFIKVADQTWAQFAASWKILMSDLIDLLSTDFVKRATSIVHDFAVDVAGIFDLLSPGFSAGLDGMLTGVEATVGAMTSITDKMRKEALAELDADMKFAEEIYRTTIEAIGDDFEGRDRKGQNFADFVKGDLATAESEMAAFIDRLAAKAEAAFTSATTGSDEGKMGPFIPDEIRDQREAVANLAVALGLLDDETEQHRDNVEDVKTGYKDWIKELEEARTAMLIEISLLEGMSDAERIRLEAKQRGLELTQQQVGAIQQMENELVTLDRQRERAEDLRDLFEDLGDEVGSAFEDVVFGASSAEEAIEGMVKNITRLIFEMLVTQQIAGLIAGALGSAFGGGGGGGGSAFNPNLPGGSVGPGNALGGVHGPLRPMQSGGLLGPLPTRMTDGGSNFLTREAGPEAVVPLGRDSQGRLGIYNAGSGGGGQTINVTMNIQTPDRRSFEDRKSMSQVERRVRKAVQGGSNLPG